MLGILTEIEGVGRHICTRGHKGSVLVESQACNLIHGQSSLTCRRRSPSETRVCTSHISAHHCRRLTPAAKLTNIHAIHGRADQTTNQVEPGRPPMR